MAMSFARPDPSSPNSVASATFAMSRRGFDQGEVRDFLRMLAAELARLQEREKFLERELRTAQRSAPHAAVVLDDEVVTKMLGEETARILQAAREAANQIRSRSEEQAARLVREATDEAQRRREEAEIETSRRRQDATADAEAELEMAKQQGREMVNEARAYRERVLSELSRRRELARQQIEQLVHGRDRLLQAFERARIAAVDVMAELTPLGEPSEYVNLSPTTGPVPLMVPNHGAEQPAVAAPAGAVETAAEHDDAADEPADGEYDEVDDTDDEYDDEYDDEPADGEYDEVDDIDDDLVDDDLVDDDLVDDDLVDDELEGHADDEAAGEDGDDDETTLDELDAAFADDTDDPDDVAAPVADDRPAPDPELNADAEAEPEADADAPLAPVVALFAGEIDRPEVDDDALPASAPKATVDDLFARLRAARAEDVAAKAQAATDTGTDEPPNGTADTTTATPAATPSVFDATPEAPVEAAADADDTPFSRREAAITPLIIAGARKLKRVLADEQNDVLHALRRGTVDRLDALVPKAAEHIGRYTHAIHEELRSAALAGAASLDGREAAAHEREIVKAHALQTALDALADRMVDPLRERLDRAVADAAGDPDELTEHVRAIYREWKTQRIDEHVEDVVRIAFGHGALAVLTPGTPICWAVDPNGPACPDADDNALGGAVAAGQPFPTDHLCAPAHPGCRCLLVRASS